MNKKLAIVCMISALSFAASACDTGEYNDLKCDASYKAECLSSSQYMVCENSELVVKQCGNNSYCKVGDDGVGACVAYTTEPECTAENVAEKCTDPTKPVCSAEGKCVAAEPECTADNAAEKCTDPTKPVCSAEGKCVAAEPECTADNAAETCTDPTKPVCSAEGKCVAEEPECTADNAAENCTDPTKPVCSAEGKCVAAEPECTADNAAEKCTDPTKPVCSAEGKCVAAEPECTAENAAENCTDPTKPVCSAEGKCVAEEPECTAENAAEKCTDPTKPVCSAEGKCVAEEPECAYDKFCTDGKVCTDGKCVDPECDADNPCETGKMCYNGACITEPAVLNPAPMENVVVTPAALAEGETAPSVPAECIKININTADPANADWDTTKVDFAKSYGEDALSSATFKINAADVCVEISGEIAGTLTIDDKSNNYGATIVLNGLTINESAAGSGLAIKNKDITKHYVMALADGSTNVISGGANSSSKKVLSCGANLDIVGNGSLTVNAKYKTGVAVDDVLKIYSGTLNVNVSRDENVVWDKDEDEVTDAPEKGFGLKIGNGFEMVGGALNIFAHDTKEYKGVEPRGVKVDGTDGDENITAESEDCKAESNYGAGKGYVKIKGGDIVIQSDAKALSAGWDIAEDFENSCDADNPTPDLEISGGRIQIRTFGDVRDEPVNPEDDPKLSPEGIEAKNDLTITGGEITVFTSDDAINAGHDIHIKGGKIIAWSSQNDAIDSNHELYIEGGQIAAMGMHGRECGLDADYNEDVYYTNGTVMALSGNNNAPQGNGNANFAQVVLGNESLAGKTIVVSEKDTDTIIAAMQVPANYNSGNNLVVLDEKIKAGETYRVLVGATLNFEDGASLFDTVLGIMLDGAATFTGGDEYLVKAGLVPVEPPHGAKPSSDAEKGLD